MKFLIDAQLPARLVHLLTSSGHDAIHTSSLPSGNRSSDTELARLADADDRVVVSKDRDFRDSHFLKKEPRQLLVVAVGNTKNDDLLALFEANLTAIIQAFETANYIELYTDELVVYPTRHG